MKQEQASPFADSIDKISEAIDSAIVTTVHRMDDDADLNLDNILVSLAEAHAYVIHSRVIARVADRVLATPPERIEVTEITPPTKGELPPLQEQGHDKPQYRAGLNKALKRPTDFKCPACDAEPGTNCFTFTGPGRGAATTGERNNGSYYHGKRTTLAAAANKTIRKQYRTN